MKKRLFIMLLTALAVIASAFGFVACKDDPSNSTEIDSEKFDGTYKFYSCISDNGKSVWYDTGSTYIFDNGKYTITYPEGVHGDIKGEYSINKDGALEFTVDDVGYIDGTPVNTVVKYVCEYVEDGVLKLNFDTDADTPVEKSYLCKDGLLPPGVDKDDILGPY